MIRFVCDIRKEWLAGKFWVGSAALLTNADNDIAKAPLVVDLQATQETKPGTCQKQGNIQKPII